MTLASGTKLGPYRIVESIGAGGMGEVYKSEDTRLGRTVAVKVLPAHLADNAELRERFEREARAISSLNHPHICPVHDVGRENGVDFIVMELLEGETLADRLTRRALSLDDALRYGVEIAETPHVSPDRSYLVGLNVREADVWLLPIVGGAQPHPYLETPFAERHPRTSPDGNWLAYSSNESGREEVYVQSFPEPGGKVQISNAGGEQPIWRSDGKELFYLEGGRRLMAVPIEMGGVLEPGLPAVLFETPFIGGAGRYHYDASADGQRFIAIVPVEDAATTPIHVVLDGMSDVER